MSGRIESLLIILMLAATGCTLSTPRPKGKSPLHQPQMSPNSIALEIFTIRIPPGDSEQSEQIWREVDEQRLPAELRRRLAKNGFRAGLVGGQIPQSLAKLLDLKEKASAVGEAQEVNLASPDSAPRVVMRHLQTRSGHRNEIIASSVYDQLPLLLNESGELRGRTYSQAQGVFSLVASPQSDGRVLFELVPEIQHDQPQQHWVGDQAMWRLDAGRPKRVFDDMKIAATLSSGEVLLLSSQQNRPGSLGYYFFTEKGQAEGAFEQKLLLVRLCQTQHDDLLTPPPLPIDP